MRTGYAILFSLTVVLIPAISARYVLKDAYVGEDFFQNWIWETMDDPTHGRVNYIDQAAARAKNLSHGELPSMFPPLSS